ncbi:hypothetical protein ACFX1Z_026279 [Malus domestica]
MALSGVEELVVHLDQALDLSSMEQGVKLIGKVLTSKLLNKWGVRNILRSAWKELGEVDIKWVRDNTFLILVQDKSMASKILEQVPWAVMKKVFSVKKWPPELALEEVEMETVPFWVQIRGVPLGSTSLSNIQRLTQVAGQFIVLEDPGKARGFLRVRLLIDTGKPLCNGCWIRRDQNRDTWVDFRYERLQDFCYRCGRIGHCNTECTFQARGEGGAAYGEWTKAPPVRDVLEPVRLSNVGMGERRQAGEVRGSGRPPSHNQRGGRVLISPRENVTRDSAPGAGSVHQGRNQKKWRRKPRSLDSTGQGPRNEIGGDRTFLAQIEEGGSYSCTSENQHEGGGQSGSILAGTEDVIKVGGVAEWGIKRGMALQSLELSTSPLKKFRGLVVERAFLEEDERREGQCEACDRTAFLEDVTETDQDTSLVHKAGKMARGGGGWPSTAARQP